MTCALSVALDIFHQREVGVKETMGTGDVCAQGGFIGLLNANTNLNKDFNKARQGARAALWKYGTGATATEVSPTYFYHPNCVASKGTVHGSVR